MSEYVTKGHFDGAIATIRQDIHDIIGHFNRSQGDQNERFDRRFDRLDTDVKELKENMAKVKSVVVDIMPVDRHLRNLTTELRVLGVPVDDRKVFS